MSSCFVILVMPGKCMYLHLDSWLHIAKSEIWIRFQKFWKLLAEYVCATSCWLTRERPSSPSVLIAQWIEDPPGVQLVKCSIPVGDWADFFFSDTCVVLINPPFTKTNYLILFLFAPMHHFLKPEALVVRMPGRQDQ